MKKIPTQKSFKIFFFLAAQTSPKFSSIHNFLSVDPKIMKFVLTQSLFREVVGKEILKT
jgi:hypothetical protein